MLLEMLEKSNSFQLLPRSQKEITVRLAEVFELDDSNLTLTPAELTTHTSLGSRQLWHDFLNNETVKAFIKGQMAALASVATRKAFSSLTRGAANGDVGAAKQVNELSGILNSGDNNKVVVLHQIQRSPIIRREPDEKANS